MLIRIDWECINKIGWAIFLHNASMEKIIMYLKNNFDAAALTLFDAGMW